MSANARASSSSARTWSAASSTSRAFADPSHARAQSEENLVQLLELLGRRTCSARPGGDGLVETFLRGIELVQDQQRLAALFLEGHRGDGPSVIALVIGPDESRVRRHFDVLAERFKD